MTDLDTFLDALETTAGAHGYKLITAAELAVMIREARAKLDAEKAEPAPPEHWSDWLRHRQGDPCPVPPSAKVETRKGDEQVWPGQAGYVPWHCVTSFRYLAADPAGWLPRGDWIPPTWLWDEGCPVRCEWRAADAGGVQSAGSCQPRNWHTITHIRLVARNLEEATQPEPAAVPELPEYVSEVPNPYGGVPYYRFELTEKGATFHLASNINLADLDRIAEAARILAARRRAGL